MSRKEREIFKDLDVSKWKVFKGDELSNADYHAEKDHSSSSNLKDLNKTEKGKWTKEGELWGREKYFQEKILGVKKEQISKPAFDEGSLAHCLILEPHMLHTDFAIYPGFRKAGNDWKTFKAAEEVGKNRTIVSKSQFKKVESWVKAYERNPAAVDLIANSFTEYSLFGEIDGVKIKVRADAIDIERGIIADVKTTAYDIDVESFSYTIDDFGYKLSGALYAKLFSMFYGRPFVFKFIVLGKKCKGCEVYKLGEKSVREGDKGIRDALSVYKQCSESGLWVNPEVSQVKKLEVKTYDNYEILEV